MSGNINTLIYMYLNSEFQYFLVYLNTLNGEKRSKGSTVTRQLMFCTQYKYVQCEIKVHISRAQ